VPAGAVGCFLNYYLPDKYGRIATIQLSCVLALIGSAMQTGATNFPVFCAGRVLGGIGNGIVFSLCPTYAAEIASPEIRGRVGALYGFNVNFAYMLTEWMGLGFYFIKGNAAWRTLLGIQLVPAAFMLIASFWMPHSPRWLVMKGRDDEALEVLQKLHKGVSGHEEDFYIKEFHQIKAQYQLEKAESLGLIAIIKRPSYRKRLYLIMTFTLFAQCVGSFSLKFL
jgi:MFS family permease